MKNGPESVDSLFGCLPNYGTKLKWNFDHAISKYYYPENISTQI